MNKLNYYNIEKLKTRFFLIILLLSFHIYSFASFILIPMDESQANHLKAYGIAFLALEKKQEIQWLLNYKNGSFLIPQDNYIKGECSLRGVSFEIISDAKAQNIITEISRDEVNMDNIKLHKAPKIAVYTPTGKNPWDDAVTLALNYAEIKYDLIYDEQIIEGKLKDYDWLHLHHEDFTGQYGKFYASYRHMKWYKDEVNRNTSTAKKLNYDKVSKMKLAVCIDIRNFVKEGGFLFAMCSATDSFDIALAAQHTDICSNMFDGDGMETDAQEKLDFTQTLAFKDFTIEKNPFIYEYSSIDATMGRRINKSDDFFTLFDFSAKWDPVPTMLCQNHKNLIKGFMGQTTAFKTKYIKSDVLIMGENKSAKEARYIHGTLEKGTWTFYAGHDPEDYQHRVGDRPTELKLHKNSPGYRLILNNVLFPAAKKKKRKT